MTAAILFGTLFGAGAMMVLAAQSHGAPKPSLATRLAALRPDVVPEPVGIKERVFRTRVFEEVLRPAIERAGEAAVKLAGHLGLDLSKIEEQLRITGDRGGLTLFFGQKVASALVGLTLLPVASAMRVGPALPRFGWLALAAVGFFMPDLILRARAQTARRRMREELVRLTEMLTLAVSAGLGLEGAMDQVSRAAEGRLFTDVRRLLRDAQLRGEASSAALSRLATEAGLPEIEPLATAVSTAAAQGTPVTQALRAQARGLRERRRLELIEAGERAQIRMLLPVGLLILPAFFVIVLYPAAIQMLRITGL